MTIKIEDLDEFEGLTADMVRAGCVMDALKLMRAWFPTWTDEQRHDVLWNCTAYPCGGGGYITAQLRALRVKAIRGATPDRLIAEADQELLAAMEERE